MFWNNFLYLVWSVCLCHCPLKGKQLHKHFKLWEYYQINEELLDLKEICSVSFLLSSCQFSIIHVALSPLLHRLQLGMLHWSHSKARPCTWVQDCDVSLLILVIQCSFSEDKEIAVLACKALRWEQQSYMRSYVLCIRTGGRGRS